MALTPNGYDPREGKHDIEMRFLIAQDGPKPTKEQLEKQKNLRSALFEVADAINNDVEDGREKSLAITKLEEALMWAGKAIFK